MEQPDAQEAAPPLAAQRASRPLLALFSLQDTILLVYLTIAWLLAWHAPASPDKAWCFERIFACMATVVLGCVIARTPSGFPWRSRWVIYRVALAGVLLENYLMLRNLLPTVRPDSVDAQLLHLDQHLFGVEPALWLERLNHQPIIEYFAFFYFSYFFICGTYLVAVVFLSKGGRQTAEFAIGTLFVFCVGQLGYMAVPAFGPIRYLADTYHGPIHGGFFWSCVSETVAAGSAMKDVFPSLHTAVPTWLTLFAFHRARVDRRWRWPARATGFFAANIIVSTMVLRWHYAIDVVAGLTLATTSALITFRLAEREESWRARFGLRAPWAIGPEEAGQALAPR